MDSYGYVETRGLVTAIEAADAALKAANVTLTNYYYVKGGIVTIEVMGDVAAVNAAVDAAVESAKRLGNFLSSNVIARMAAETKKILINDNGKKKTVVQEKSEEKVIEETLEEKIEERSIVENTDKKETIVEQTEDIVVKEPAQEIFEKASEEISEKIETIEKMEDVLQKEEVKSELNDGNQENKEISLKKTSKKEEEIKKLRKEYQDTKVVDLKTKVNNLKLGYTWNQIKTMPKKKLIEILIKNNQEE